MKSYHVDLKPVENILRERGVLPGGRIQRMVTNEIIRISDPYVPMDNGPLKNQTVIAPDATYYDHIVPYARYHWHGKLMVDPVYKKGAFFNPDFGFWSRPGIQKELTETNLNYRGAPLRGPKWTLRAWADNKDNVIAKIEKEINK